MVRLFQYQILRASLMVTVSMVLSVSMDGGDIDIAL
jgi:hypothetical protein